MAEIQADIQSVLQAQRTFFQAGKTRSHAFRAEQLLKLEDGLRSREKAILEALASDLRKPAYEGYLGEVWFSLEESRYARKRLKRWMRPERVRTSMLLQPGKSEIWYEPKGVVLILGPWNYPFQLMISPLIAAIAAGNCAILKPSELAPATSRVIGQLIQELFAPEFVACFEGAAEVASSLLNERFDHIFFTGGGAVGRIVMTAAAKHLTPVTLELGGKSPCLIDESVDFKVAARRIVWGKFFNAGQTCVAPDYLLVKRSEKERWIAEINRTVSEMFGENPKLSRDYGRIVNERHFHRLKSLMGRGRVVMGGEIAPDQLYIAPTLIDEVSESDPIMQEEIFGPLLPMQVYDDLEEAIRFVKARPKPLAFYLFSKDRSVQQKVLSEISFGGGCVNDTLLHLNNPALPFGGVGESGMGAYHGHFGFLEFSHRKSVVRKGFRFDLPIRYAPYGERLNWIRRLLG